MNEPINLKNRGNEDIPDEGTWEPDELLETGEQHNTGDKIEDFNLSSRNNHHQEDDNEEQSPEDSHVIYTSKEMRENKSGKGRFFNYLLKGAVFAAAFLVPLFYFFSGDLIDLSKSMLLSSLVLIAVVSWLGKILAQGEIRWRSSKLVWSAILLGLVAIASTILSVSPWVSTLGDFSRYSFSLINIASYIILFIVAVQNLNKSDALWLVVAMVISGAIAAFFSLLQFAEIFVLPGSYTKTKLFTPAGPAFSMTVFVTLSLPLLLEFIYEVPKKWMKIIWGILGVFVFLVALLVNLNAVWIALAVTSAVLVVVKFYKSVGEQRRLVLPVALLVATILLIAMPSLPVPRLNDIPPQLNPSYSAGLDIVKDSWGSDIKNTLVGAGPEMFTIEYEKYKSAELNASEVGYWGVNFSDANAEVITWLVSHGILGALAWLLFVFGFIFLFFRELRRKDVSNLEIGLFASWLFIVVTKFLYQSPVSVEIFFWLLPAMFMVISGASRGYKKERVYNFQAGSTKTLIVFTVLIILIVVGVGGLYLSLQRWVAESAFAGAVSLENNSDNRDKIIEKATKAVSLNPYDARYYSALSQVLLDKVDDVISEASQGVNGEQQLDVDQAQEIQNLTVAAFNSLKRAEALDPQNTALLITIAESYQRMSVYVGGAIDRAIDIYNTAAELEPINPFLKTRLAQLYLIRDGFFLNPSLTKSDGIDKARRQLEAALSLNPRYSNAHYFLGFIKDRVGDRTGALEHFIFILSANPDIQAIQIIVQNLQNGFPALGPPRPPAAELAPVSTGEAQGVPEGVEEE